MKQPMPLSKWQDEETMNGILNEFEDISETSDAKKFEQSQEREKNILEVPVAYQEFDKIEHELDGHVQSLNEVGIFASQLENYRTVSQGDALALESMCGDAIVLPNIKSYTQEASYVNYRATLESVWSTIKDFSVKVAKSMWAFILKTIEYLTSKFAEWLGLEEYNTNDVAQSRTETKVQDIKKATENYDNVVTVKVEKLNADKRDKRNVRINKELRELLYPKYTELAILSLGGEINGQLLIDEICEQRLKPKFTTTWKLILEKDESLKALIHAYDHIVSQTVWQVSFNSKEALEGDLNDPPPNIPTGQVFDVVPDALIDFSQEHTTYRTQPSQVYQKAERYKVITSEIMNMSKEMCSKNLIHPLPQPRTILDFDIDWLSGLHLQSDNDWLKSLVKEYKEFKNIYRKQEPLMKNYHPDRQTALKMAYNDWTVINRMIMTTLNFRQSSEMLWGLIENTMNDIKKVLDILSK